MIAAAAMRLGQPVKWIEDRREHFMCATQERDQYWDVEIAVDRDGRIAGVRGAMLHDTGAFVPWGIIMPYIAAATMPGPYVLPAYRLDVRVALTNKVATTPVRGAGRPQAVFAMERLMDRVARELGLDRAEVRRRNFMQPEQMPYAVGVTFRDGKPLVYDSGDYPKGQRIALEMAAYDDFKSRQAKALAQGRYIGIGIGNYVEGDGARAVRGRHRARAAERQGRGRHRRHDPGPGHAHDALADRGRCGRLPDRGHRVHARRYQRHRQRRRRVRQPAGRQRPGRPR